MVRPPLQIINRSGTNRIMWLFDDIIVEVVANTITAICHVLLSMWLIILYKKRRKETYEDNWLLGLFIIFIFSCGINRLLGVLAFYFTIDRLVLLSAIKTAVISLVLTILLPKIIRKEMVLESPLIIRKLNDELRLKVEEKTASEAKIRELNHELATQVMILQNRLKIQGWVAEKQVDLDKMKEIVTELRKEYVRTDKTSS